MPVRNSIHHKCSPGGECFCVYDPECNPNATAMRLIPVEVDQARADVIRVARHWLAVEHGDRESQYEVDEPAMVLRAALKRLDAFSTTSPPEEGR